MKKKIAVLLTMAILLAMLPMTAIPAAASAWQSDLTMLQLAEADEEAEPFQIGNIVHTSFPPGTTWLTLNITHPGIFTLEFSAPIAQIAFYNMDGKIIHNYGEQKRGMVRPLFWEAPTVTNTELTSGTYYLAIRAQGGSNWALQGERAVASSFENKCDFVGSEWNVTRAATCGQDGMRERRCLICNDQNTEIIPKRTGTCADCGVNARRIGDVTDSRGIGTDDALEILRFAVGLPSIIRDGNCAFHSALIVQNATRPSPADALEVLKRVIGLPSLVPN